MTTVAPTQQWLPGIIGMSVHTDCVYLQEINRADPRRADGPRASSVQLLLAGIDFDTVTTDFHEGRTADGLDALAVAIDSVQQGGADFLVLTANTMSAKLVDLADTVSVPVLEIARPVFVRALDQGLSRLGLLGTRATAASGMYQSTGAEYGCTVLEASDDLADALDEAIYRRLTRGIFSDEDAATVLAATSRFAEQGADGVILGCTDLTLLGDRLAGAALPLVDSTVLHARAAYQVAMRGDLGPYAAR